MYRVYVYTEEGKWMVQIMNSKSRFGFFLTDGKYKWDGGIGIAKDWKIIATERVPHEIRQKFSWLVEAKQ